MKILMVCLGNICRSPLAEGIMQHQADKQHLNWEIESAGTGNWHVGQGPDRRSTRVAASRGVDISKQVCRQFKVADFDRYDRIFVMDKNNLADVLALAPNKAAADKVQLLLDNQEVPDPYFDDQQFEPVFDLIEGACKDIIKSHINKR